MITRLFLFIIILLINKNAFYNGKQINTAKQRKEIAFTMDGLGINKQEEILKILKKYNIRSSFAINEGILLKNYNKKNSTTL